MDLLKELKNIWINLICSTEFIDKSNHLNKKKKKLKGCNYSNCKCPGCGPNSLPFPININTCSCKNCNC